MTEDRNISDGSVHEITELSSRNLTERTEEDREESVRIANVPVQIPNEHILRVNADHTVLLKRRRMCL
jgi:hypothetical protein